MIRTQTNLDLANEAREIEREATEREASSSSSSFVPSCGWPGWESTERGEKRLGAERKARTKRGWELRATEQSYGLFCLHEFSSSPLIFPFICITVPLNVYGYTVRFG